MGSGEYLIVLPSATPISNTLQDLDGGLIGQTVAQTFIGGSGLDTKMTWMAAPSNLNLTTREQFEHAVVQEMVWAIVTGSWHPLCFLFNPTDPILS